VRRVGFVALAASRSEDTVNQAKESELSMFAMLTANGTACSEAALCVRDDTPANRDRREHSAAAQPPDPGSPVLPGSWAEVSGNEAIVCTLCGEPDDPVRETSETVAHRLYEAVEHLQRCVGERTPDAHDQIVLDAIYSYDRWRAASVSGLYVIAGPVDDEDGTLYWSNEDGWGSLSTATVFTETERATGSLPMGDGSDRPEPRWSGLPGLIDPA
jgi:hypothetical protein